VKAVGAGVWELRFHFGPGYRVYYYRVGIDVVLLLCGGDKSAQKRDILAAKRHLAEFKGRTK
jgi:putative addiction module killer protein